jgi:hypothetical protein
MYIGFLLSLLRMKVEVEIGTTATTWYDVVGIKLEF